VGCLSLLFSLLLLFPPLLPSSLSTRMWRKKHDGLPREKHICRRSSINPGKQKISTFCSATPGRQTSTATVAPLSAMSRNCGAPFSTLPWFAVQFFAHWNYHYCLQPFMSYPPQKVYSRGSFNLCFRLPVISATHAFPKLVWNFPAHKKQRQGMAQNWAASTY
jgi:hypothetical protein